MTRRNATTVAFLVVLLAACDNAQTNSCWLCPTTKPPFYKLSRVQPNILKGDTVRFGACITNEFCPIGLGDSVNALSSWRVSPASVAGIVKPTGIDTAFASSTNVLVRAIAPGQAIVTAQSLTMDTTASTSVTVADSSAMTTISVNLCESLFLSNSCGRIRLGATAVYSAVLLDAQGNWYYAQPTSYSVSDSSALQAMPYLAPPGFGGVQVRGLKLGAYTLSAHFLSVTKAVQVTVVP